MENHWVPYSKKCFINKIHEMQLTTYHEQNFGKNLECGLPFAD